jgi:hypothetical protein
MGGAAVGDLAVGGLEVVTGGAWPVGSERK